jgi:hypothetical protein
MMSWFRKTTGLPVIDSEQRWLVTPRDRKVRKILRARRETVVSDVVIGEVSSNGRYFKIKESYNTGWHELSEYIWLDHLI